MGSSRDERRVAAIAFADVVGYSTLMAADEHGTYARWMALLSGVIEPETARHAGRILHVAGDGILLEFPEANDAVVWARGVQQPRRPITWGTVRSRILMSIHSDQLAT